MNKSIVVVLLLFIAACDGGLQSVPPVQPGIGGMVRFSPGSWPPIDSLVNLWVFASQIYPLDSTSVFTNLFTKIFIYPTETAHLALNVDSVAYFFPLPPATYRYVGVIQRVSIASNIRSFRVVGFYYDSKSPTQPLEVIVHESQQASSIDMMVDFNNPPAQPF